MEDWHHYEVLCIANYSTAEEVRVAYKALALKYHPDKNLNDPTAVDRFRAVSRAYEVLSNAESKRKYDIGLRATLAVYGSRGSAGAGAAPGSNPYAAQPTSMADIYRELYQRQAARANTRNRTSSTAPKEGPTAASQYSKAQQELFRKREKERQQELRRQREKERKEQRDREREALRREQERQEELLQQRWRQQQQQHQQQQQKQQQRVPLTRVSARFSAPASPADGPLSTHNGAATTPRGRRGLPRAFMGDDGHPASSGEAPNTLHMGTPLRTTFTERSGRANAATPASPTTSIGAQRADSFASSQRPGSASGRGRNGASASGLFSPSSTSRVDEHEEDDEGEEDHDAEGVRSAQSQQWYSPMSSPAGPSEAGDDAGPSRRSSDASGAAAVAPTGGDGITAASSISNVSADVHRVLQTARFTVSGRRAAKKAASSPERTDEDGATASSVPSPAPAATAAGAAAPARPMTRVSRPVLSGAPVRTSSSGASAAGPSTRRRGTPVRHSASYAAGAPLSPGVSPVHGYPTTPRGTGASRSHSSSAGATLARPRSTHNTPSRTSTSGTTGTASSAAAQAVLQRARPMTSLAEEDREVLDKKRRERLAKEKERQRAVLLAEEERQFRRRARQAKQQQRRSSQQPQPDDDLEVSSASATLTADAAAPDTEQPPSLSELLAFLIQDEASERDQLIEREEHLARRRLHRQHTTVTQAAVLRRQLAALATEEVVRRNVLLQTCRAERDRYFFYFHERLDRLYVEASEGRDRRQLAGREAAGVYHAQRVVQKRMSLLAEEAQQRRRLSGASLRALAEDLAAATASPKRSAGDGRTSSTSLPASTPPLDAEQRSCSGGSGGGAGPRLSPAGQVLAAALTGLATGDAGSTPATARSLTALHVPDTPRVDRAGNRLSSIHDADRDRHASPDGRSSLASSTNQERWSLGASTASAGAVAVHNGDRRLSLAAAERRMAAVLADEARLRGALVRQQHLEEVALRRRRAAALHRVFAKERDDAVRRAQRCAAAEVTALKAQLRVLQRHTSGTTTPQQRTGSPAGLADSLGSRREASSSAAASRHASPLATPSRPSVDAAAPCASPASTARPSAPASTPAAVAAASNGKRSGGGGGAAAASGGWIALPDSDVDGD